MVGYDVRIYLVGGLLVALRLLKEWNVFRYI